jgi:predicted TIM-barrel fold metal-dependent hydrolase
MATNTTAEEIPAAAREDRIIDLDFHLTPPTELLLEYIEDERLRQKLTTEFGIAPIGGKWDAAYATPQGEEGLYTQGRAEFAEDVRLAADKFAIDEPIVNAGINNMPAQHHPVLKNAVAGAANDFLRERIVPEDLYCLMMLPQWDIEYAVEEIERVGGEDGIVGAYGWFGPMAMFGNEKYDPIYEALTRHDLPLILHGSLAFWPQHTTVGDNMRTWTEVLGFDWPLHAMATAVNLIMTGTFDKFPELNVVLQEGGHWWVPFLRYRMDEFYEMHPEDIQITPRKFEADERYLHRKPSEYLRENMYVCTQPFSPPTSAKETEQLLDLSMAEDMFLYSSDWPHQTLDPATWAYRNRAVDERLKNKILHENAAELLGI